MMLFVVVDRHSIADDLRIYSSNMFFIRLRDGFRFSFQSNEEKKVRLFVTGSKLLASSP